MIFSQILHVMRIETLHAFVVLEYNKLSINAWCCKTFLTWAVWSCDVFTDGKFWKVNFPSQKNQIGYLNIQSVYTYYYSKQLKFKTPCNYPDH